MLTDDKIAFPKKMHPNNLGWAFWCGSKKKMDKRDTLLPQHKGTHRRNDQGLLLCVEHCRQNCNKPMLIPGRARQ